MSIFLATIAAVKNYAIFFWEQTAEQGPGGRCDAPFNGISLSGFAHVLGAKYITKTIINREAYINFHAMVNTEFLNEIKRLKAIADTGLLYCKNEYDKERYLELQDIVFNFLHKFSSLPVEELKVMLPPQKDYPTAKVDIRGILFSNDQKVLMVKESLDGKWSLPGGWGDIGYSPKETIIKEFKEETGLDVSAERLLAVFDKKMHPHPPQPWYVYKMVFFCKNISTEISKGFDVLDVQYFDIENLPELSEDRILKSQLILLVKKVLSNDMEVYVD